MAAITDPVRGCDCDICNLSHAIKSVSAGFDSLLNNGLEHDMAHAHLRDEVEAIVKDWRSILVRGRLRKALKVTHVRF